MFIDSLLSKLIIVTTAKLLKRNGIPKHSPHFFRRFILPFHFLRLLLQREMLNIQVSYVWSYQYILTSCFICVTTATGREANRNRLFLTWFRKHAAPERFTIRVDSKVTAHRQQGYGSQTAGLRLIDSRVTAHKRGETLDF